MKDALKDAWFAVKNIGYLLGVIRLERKLSEMDNPLVVLTSKGYQAFEYGDPRGRGGLN